MRIHRGVGHTDNESQSAQHFDLENSHTFVLCSWWRSNLGSLDLESTNWATPSPLATCVCRCREHRWGWPWPTAACGDCAPWSPSRISWAAPSRVAFTASLPYSTAWGSATITLCRQATSVGSAKSQTASRGQPMLCTGRKPSGLRERQRSRRRTRSMEWDERALWRHCCCSLLAPICRYRLAYNCFSLPYPGTPIIWYQASELYAVCRKCTKPLTPALWTACPNGHFVKGKVCRKCAHCFLLSTLKLNNRSFLTSCECWPSNHILSLSGIFNRLAWQRMKWTEQCTRSACPRELTPHPCCTAGFPSRCAPPSTMWRVTAFPTTGSCVTVTSSTLISQ